MKLQILGMKKQASSLGNPAKKSGTSCKRSRNLIASIFFIVAGCSSEILPNSHQAAIAGATYNSSSPLGTNLNGISYYSSELPFVDAFPSASGWVTQTNNTWDTGEESKLDVDQNGWLKSLPTSGSGVYYTKVSTLMYRELQNLYPSDDYVVLYDGQGTMTYGFDAKIKQSSPGRDVISVDSSKGGGILLTITSTDPNHTGNYIRNVHVVQQKYESTFKTSPFNPTFISSIQKFRTLRFMEWMNTNNSTQQYWQDRPVPQTAFYVPEFYSNKALPKGVPLEVMLQLSNQIQAEPWFNMPHMADDNYITAFAQQVKANLSPNLSVYVEYSNEVWNTQFGQAVWVGQQGANQWPNASPNPADQTIQRRNKYGERTAQMCDIWKQVFYDQPARVKCVMGGQVASTDVAQDALECKLSALQPCDKHGIYAIAVAPYIGYYLGDPATAYQVQNWNLNQLFQELYYGGVLAGGPSGGALSQSYKWITANASLAQQKNLKLVAYEGGQGLVGYAGQENNVQLTNLFIAANKDSRMHDLYINLFSYWKNTAGSEVFVHFNDTETPGKWGSWGSLEYVSQSYSPKYQALTDFINYYSCWWSNCNITPTTGITPINIVPSPIPSPVFPPFHF